MNMEHAVSGSANHFDCRHSNRNILGGRQAKCYDKTSALSQDMPSLRDSRRELLSAYSMGITDSKLCCANS